MSEKQASLEKFDGEEAGAGYASPFLDLVASIFLLILSLIVIFASYALPVPGGVLHTAPGLLPLLTAASLLLMALMLAMTALRRRGNENAVEDIEVPDQAERLRTLGLAASVAIYIGGLQFLAFQYYFSIGGVNFTISAFEPVTVVALAAIIKMSWQGPLWIIASVATGWTLVLSLVFQKLFEIPLPGGF